MVVVGACLRKIAYVLCLVVLAWVGVRQSMPTPAAAASAPQMGVQWHAVWSSYTDEQRIQVLDEMKTAGLQWVRIDVGWDMIESSRQGYYDPYWTSRLDTFIEMAVARGLKPLVTLYQTPAWARPAGTTNRTPPSDPLMLPGSPAGQPIAGRIRYWPGRCGMSQTLRSFGLALTPSPTPAFCELHTPP